MTSGISVGLDSPDLAELAAHAGFEYVWLEWQHGQFSEHTLNNAIARFLPVETAPIVRVKSHEPGAINHVLDMGAMGVIVPMVETAAEARAIAHVTYYPPLGRRSTGGMRLGLLGDDYTERANDEMLLVVMVETESAINNVHEIMAVPGVDVVLIGPGDLMLDVQAQGKDAAYHEHLVQQVLTASQQTGVAAGFVCPSLEVADERVAQGFRFVSCGSDSGLLRTGFQSILQHTRTW
jgi:2-keto-3-deoxy-L-rhamnonate aldolase RhmA